MLTVLVACVRVARCVVLALLFVATVSAPASAADLRPDDGGGPGTGSNRPNQKAPEIDPSLAGAAAILVVGGLLLLTDRRRAAQA